VPLRVIVFGSGSFLGSIRTRIDIGLSYGVPDLAWTERIAILLHAEDVNQLINGASAEQLQHAGKVSGEELSRDTTRLWARQP
jgi:hypothetical protein